MPVYKVTPEERDMFDWAWRYFFVHAANKAAVHRFLAVHPDYKDKASCTVDEIEIKHHIVIE